MDRGANGPPAVRRTVEPEPLDRFHSSVHGDPGHDLSVRKVSLNPTDFLDPFIGMIPGRLQKFHQCTLEFPDRFFRGDSGLSGLMKHIHDLAVYVELELLRSDVSNAHRTDISHLGS